MKTLMQLSLIILTIISLSGCQSTPSGDQNGDAQGTSDDQSSNYYNGNDGGYRDNTGEKYTNRENNQERGQENSRLDEGNKGLGSLPALKDSESDGDNNSSHNYEKRFFILGNVDANVNSKSYSLKAVVDYKGVAFASGYTFDPMIGKFHIQVAGHDIAEDSWRKDTGSIMIKFNMPNMSTTGVYTLNYPANSSGQITIDSIEPSVNNTYIVNGKVVNAQIYNESKTATINTSIDFHVALVPLYK
jgi:hypothetical protein